MLNACTKLGHFTEGKEIIQQILAKNDPILVQNTTLVTTMIDLLVSSLIPWTDFHPMSTIYRAKAAMVLNYVFDCFNRSK